MITPSDTAHIKSELQARIVDLARELAPDGYRAGKYWLAKNPTRDDRNGGSFWITIIGPATGAWRDEATGDKGDVFGLIQYVQRFSQFSEAKVWAKRWLNYEDLPAPKRAEAAAARAQASGEREAQEAQEIAELRNKAFAHWLRCENKLEGTIAARYLETRGIDLTQLARRPSALRFEPAAHHVETGEKFPAICAMITGADGKCVGIHRTFLARDGSGKAPVKVVRKIWPRGWAGGSIKLARGETGLSPNDAAKQGLLDTLILCEGIEDGLSLALACPELRVWAACAVGNLARIALPACCADVIIAADNDWGKPGAQAQLTAGVRALAGQKRSVRIARSHTGKDANDAIRS